MVINFLLVDVMKINSHSAALSAVIFSLTLSTSVLAVTSLDLVRDEGSPSLARVSPPLLQHGLPESHVSGDPIASSHFLPEAHFQAEDEGWLNHEEWEGYKDKSEENFKSGFTAKTPAEEMEKMKVLYKTDKDWESVGGSVGGWGPILPSAETTLQKTGRRLTNTVVFVGKLAVPFAVTRFTNVGINLVFDKLQPSVVNLLAQRSAESGSRDAAYITRWIPGGDSLVRLVYDQTMRDEVTLRLADTRNFCLNYTSALFYGASSTASLAWSRLRSWFWR